MPSALSVAKELVRLSFEGDVADPLTGFRLQKLLYYTQAWSLVTRQSELFYENLRGWRDGPVVAEVWAALPNQGKKQIAENAFDGVSDLAADEKDFVKRVWDVYKIYTTYMLRDMTHQETPWKNAWGDRPANGFGDEEIQIGDVEIYFTSQTMPGPIAAYEHEFRKAEEVARIALTARPPIDVKKFAIMAVNAPPSLVR